MMMIRSACVNMKFLLCLICCVPCAISIESTTAAGKHYEQEISVANKENATNVKETDDSNLFVEYIFKKYGSNGKISYEGFEHLLENLGLAQMKFEKNHSLHDHKQEDGGHFEEMHDDLQIHKHNHTKSRSERSADDEKSLNRNKGLIGMGSHFSDQCFTMEEMLALNNLEADHKLGISPTNFLHMCPVIVYELDRKSCRRHGAEVVKEKTTNSSDIYTVWLCASVSIIIISFVGLLGVCLVPLLQKAFFNELITFLVALAVGTLCGDSLLHLLPHAFEKEENEGESVVVLRAGTVFLSIIVFFLIETMLNSSKREDSEASIETEMKPGAETPLREKSGSHSHSTIHIHTHSHSHNKYGEKSFYSMSSVALMVIMGDGLHNLTDGLAIGAAFSGDIVSGFTTAIAVFTHELPHELGDFAVLLQTGMSVKQAMFYNIVSSVLSFIGMAAGILLGNYSSAAHWIYAITAGVFLYIGLVNLVPEMKRPGGKNGTLNTFIQVSGILCGGLIMFLIALYEHDLEHMFLQ